MSSPDKKNEETGPESAGLVARFRQRLFPANPSAAPSTALAQPSRRGISLRAGIAELLLIARLKARSHGNLATDVLERAAQIVFVTCKNWFSAGDEKTPRHRKPL
ncbi:MAG: hypothetical protein V4646_06285 [Pseudomonadota bacterium]